MSPKVTAETYILEWNILASSQHFGVMTTSKLNVFTHLAAFFQSLNNLHRIKNANVFLFNALQTK